MRRNRALTYMIFAVVAVVVLILTMLIGLFFWSFGTAVWFGTALSLVYAIAVFSFNFLRGNRIDAIAGGIFGILLALIVLMFGQFVEKLNWGDKTLIIDEVGNVRVGKAVSLEIDDVQDVAVSEVSEMNVSTIKTQNVSEIEEQNVSTIKTQNVTEIEEQNVSTIKTQNVTEIEEQNVSTIKTQNVTEIQEQNVSTIKTQNVSVIEEQNVSTIKTQNVTEIWEQNVSTIKTQNIPETTTTRQTTTTPKPSDDTTTTVHECSWQLTSSKVATCTESGYEKYSCNCGKSYTKDIAALGHDWSSFSTKKATCTESGCKIRTCHRCGKEEKTTISALGHDWSNWTTKEATCTSDGYKVRTCNRCGKEEKTTINATGHSWDSGRVTTQATCTQTGVKTYTCTKCGLTKTDTIPMVNHQTGDWQHDDYQHWHECTSCHSKFDTASHSWDTGTVTQQPTEYSEGVKTYRCSVCSRTKTESIPKLAPSKPAVIDVEATFGSPNYSHASTITVTVRFKNVTSVPSGVVYTSLGRLEVVTQGVSGSDYVIVYNITGITEANVGQSIFLSLASGYDFISDPVCSITE